MARTSPPRKFKQDEERQQQQQQHDPILVSLQELVQVHISVSGKNDVLEFLQETTTRKFLFSELKVSR